MNMFNSSDKVSKISWINFGNSVEKLKFFFTNTSIQQFHLKNAIRKNLIETCERCYKTTNIMYV